VTVTGNTALAEFTAASIHGQAHSRGLVPHLFSFRVRQRPAICGFENDAEEPGSVLFRELVNSRRELAWAPATNGDHFFRVVVVRIKT
jgi:hypothetical protein